MGLVDPASYLSEHYLYEVHMLRQTHERIIHESDSVIKNALIESFCIHARTLHDFYQKNKEKNDVIASDFTVSNGKLPNPGSPQILHALREKINKQIAHLTENRVAANKVDEADRKAYLSAIEAYHSSFKSMARKEFQHCFKYELPSGKIFFLSAPTNSTSNVMIDASSATYEKKSNP